MSIDYFNIISGICGSLGVANNNPVLLRCFMTMMIILLLTQLSVVIYAVLGRATNILFKYLLFIIIISGYNFLKSSIFFGCNDFIDNFFMSEVDKFFYEFLKHISAKFSIFFSVNIKCFWRLGLEFTRGWISRPNSDIFTLLWVQLSSRNGRSRN